MIFHSILKLLYYQKKYHLKLKNNKTTQNKKVKLKLKEIKLASLIRKAKNHVNNLKAEQRAKI